MARFGGRAASKIWPDFARYKRIEAAAPASVTASVTIGTHGRTPDRASTTGAGSVRPVTLASVCVISAARSACRENLCRRLPGRLRSCPRPPATLASGRL